MVFQIHRTRSILIFIGILIALIAAGCNTSSDVSRSTDVITLPSTNSVSAQPVVDSNASDYDIVMSVITSPRCMNCHPSDDQPRQRDEQIEHLFGVERGEDNHAGPVQTCDTCHHEENNPYSNVPGAPHWGLAPASMGWLGLSHPEIAATLLDPAKNGDRDFDELLHHMSEDALVLWAWEPGEGRTPPPVPHDEFVLALESWLNDGAPIPSE